jgi:hypothetical protein
MKLPHSYRKVASIWTLLKQGVAIWSLSIERNERIFKDHACSNQKLGHMIMNGIIAYAILDWHRTLQMIDKTKIAMKDYFAGF